MVWTVHEPGSTYERLKRIRTMHPGFAESECNPKYLQAVLQLSGLIGCKLAATPSTGGHMTIADGEVADALDVMHTKVYRMAVGTLEYTVVDRCDVQFEVNVLARQMKSPTTKSCLQLKRLVSFIAGTVGARVVMKQPRTDVDAELATLAIWSDSE
jgi:hypothetical protein